MPAWLRERANAVREQRLGFPTVGCVRDHIDELRAAIDLLPFIWPSDAPCESTSCAAHAPVRDIEPYVFTAEDDWDDLPTYGKIMFCTFFVMGIFIAVVALLGTFAFDIWERITDDPYTGRSSVVVQTHDEPRLRSGYKVHQFKDGTWYATEVKSRPNRAPRASYGSGSVRRR